MTLFNFALAALGAVATGAGTTDGVVPANLIDGSDTTFYATSGTSTYMKIDLGAPQYITSLHIHNGAEGLNWSSDFSVYFSDDGITYVFLVRRQPTGAGVVDIDTGGITYRYWRFNTASTAKWRVPTIEILGPVEAPPPPVNPAEDYITAWLDGIEANYVPTVEDWLAANP